MTSIIDFLEARLAEDEAAARAATPGRWEEDGYDPEYRTVVSQRVTSGTELGDQLAFVASFMDAVHILRHDPARVLREVQAKRAILEEHKETVTVVWWPDDEAIDIECCARCTRDPYHPDDEESAQVPCRTVRALAAIYSDHPEFRKEWAA